MDGAEPSPQIPSLVQRAKLGDASALSQLIALHLRAAHGVALAITGTYSDAADVVQQAFMVAVDKLAECREPERFSGWLIQIVRRTALGLRRTATRRERVAGQSLEHVADDVASPTGQDELRTHLLRALDELPARQREVIVLHDVEGYKHLEIAELLGISEVTSRQDLFVARKTLRQALHAESEIT